MIAVSRRRLKTKMQEYFRKVNQTAEELAFRKYSVNDLFADILGAVKYYDDLLKPETEEWRYNFN